MARRTEHQISQTFYDNLHQVKNFKFSQYPTSKIPTDSDKTFLAAIPYICDILGLQLPALINASAYPDREIYTEDTCKEYHQLLVCLIEGFRTSLKRFAPRIGDDPLDSWKPEIKQYLQEVVFWGELLQLMIDGQAIEQHLQVITCELLKSGYPGIQSEIVAESQLSKDIAGREGAEEGVDKAGGEDAGQGNAGDTDTKEGDVELAGVQVGEDTAGEDAMEDDAGNTDDIEFAGVQTFTNRVNRGPMYLWESYRDWLKLTTTHFEAIKIITGFIAIPSGSRPLISPTISIRVLAFGHQGTKMLGWEDALKEYLPGPINTRATDSAREIVMLDCAQPDVQTLIDFIKKSVNDDCTAIGVLLENVEQSLAKLKKTYKALPSSKTTRIPTFGMLKKLLSNNQPLNEKNINSAIESIECLKSQYNTPVAIESIDTAIQTIESLKIKSRWEQFKVGTKLSNGKFRGTVHCELCLAILVYLADRNKSGDDTHAFDALLKKFKVIIISSTACILLMLY